MVQSSVPWFALGGLICIELWWKRLHCDGSIKRPMVCSGGLICIEFWWKRLHCDGSIKRPMVCSGWPDLH